jgi:diguanylate cyclase (GGDEF)-like protein
MPYQFTHPTIFSEAQEGSARLLLRRVGAVMYAVGGLTMALTLLAPSAGRPAAIAFAPVGVACFVLAAYLAFGPGVPDWLLLLIPPFGTLLITAIMAIEHTTSGTPFFYLWPVLLAAYFLKAREVVLNFLFVCVSFGVALALWIPVDDGRTIMFVDVVAALGVVGALVYALKARVGRLVVGMHKASTTDALTGTLNRGAFQEELDHAMSDRRERFVLALLDLDHFKRVNDELGHPAGDRALQQFCDIVQRETRQGDALGRLGGEEFGLLLHRADAVSARGFAERLRERVEAATAGGESPLTVSIGLAEHHPGMSAAELLRTADAALYAAKDAGRNRVVVAGRPRAVA